MNRTNPADYPRGRTVAKPDAPRGSITCQACGRMVPKFRAVRACYQCAYDGKPEFACGTCAWFKECPDCLNAFCGKHADPEVHVRNRARNVLDTCAKRTRTLNRIIDSENRKGGRPTGTVPRVGRTV